MSRQGVEYAAGGVVVRGEGKDLEVLILHKRKPPEWRLPKGHLGPGETPEQAALRETAEESGYSCEIVGLLGETEHTFARKETGELRRKRTRYFLLRPTQAAAGETDGVFDQVEWVSPAEALARLDFWTERTMVELALRRLSRRGL
ncbi:MAG: NUDIX hydrolase [Armatimonadetes bacterium]|nr:NUDIX hydrolase [Armatimonadota bacterium]